MTQLQQQPQQQPQVTPATPSSSAGTTTGASNSDTEKQAALIRALAGLTKEWRALLGSLASDVPSPDAPPDTTKFRADAYSLLAKRDGLGQAGLPSVKALLDRSETRQKYFQTLEKTETDVKTDGPLREAIHDNLQDLLQGGEVKFNSDRLIARYLQTTQLGRAWWKSDDAKEWLGPFAAYVFDIPTLAQHCQDEGGVLYAQAFAARRSTKLVPLLNLLKQGGLAGAPKEAEGDKPVTGPTDEQKKQWDEQAAALKKEIEPYLPPDAAVGKDAHGATKLPHAKRTELVVKISGAAIEVRDRLFADTTFMRRVAMLGENGKLDSQGIQVQTLFRALDPIEALYDKVRGCETTAGGIVRFKTNTETGATVKPMTNPERFELLRSFMAQHPGKEGQPIRLRVVTHEGMLQGLDENLTRDLWKLATRGTLESTVEDRLYSAIKANSSEQIARALLSMSGEDRDAVKALQGDLMFRSAMESEAMRTSVNVDGVTVRPYDLMLLVWGQRPGSTKDDGQTGPVEDNPDGDSKPLNFQERQKLDKELYAPTIRQLKSDLSAADSWFFSGARTDDDDVASHLNAFQNRCAQADYVALIRRAGVPPGQELATRYNAETGQSIQSLLKGGCGDATRRAAERVLAITIDSASVGTIGGGIARANDKPDAAPIGLSQALQEVKTDNGNGDTVSIVVHRAAGDLKDELYEGLAWNGADYDDIISIWSKLNTHVDSKALAEIERLTKRKVWTIELLQNAYQEIDGPLTAALSKRLSDSDGKKALSMFGLTSGDIAKRAQAAATGPVDQKAAAREQAEQLFGSKAKELFESLAMLSAAAQKSDFDSARQKLETYVQLRSGAEKPPGVEVRISTEQAPDVKPGAGVGTPDTPEDFYRLRYGLTPKNHAVQIARSFRTLKEDEAGHRRSDGGPRHKPEEIAAWLNVGESLVAGGAVMAPPDSEKPVIDERNQQLVRPGFDVRTAESNAKEMWKLLHSGGQVRLIETTLYGMYNDEEQRLIRLAFRQLSGGIDWQFYVQQARYMAKHAGAPSSGNSFHETSQMIVGGEGTAEGQGLVDKSVVTVSGDEGQLDALSAIAEQGAIDIRDELRNAVSHGNTKQIYRIVDRADDQQCRTIMADTKLMTSLQTKLPSYGWDRVYRVLNGSDDLATRLESRAHGDDDKFFESIFGGTDEDGMNEDVREYVRRMKEKFEAEEIKKARANKDEMPDPMVIQLTVARRVRDACKKLLSHPEVSKILNEELKHEELSTTQGLILNGGEQSNVTNLTGGGSGDGVIEEIKRMPKDERERRLRDPEYMIRLQRQMKPAELQQAIKLLQSPVDEKAESQSQSEGDVAKKPEGHERLAELAKMVEHAEQHDIVLKLLTELSAEEHQRLLDDPPLIAKVMVKFQYAEAKKKEMAERILGYRATNAEQALGKGIVWPDARDNVCEGRTIDEREQQRLAYLQENAVNRILQGAMVSWNQLLAQLVEVFKMELAPRGLHDVAPPAPAQSSDPAAKPSAMAPDPNADLAKKLEQDLRKGIWERVKDSADVKKRAGDHMQSVQDAVMHVMDPSAARIREQWGTFRDDSAGVEDTLRKASDEQLIDCWVSVTHDKPNGSASFEDVYAKYRAAYDAAGGEKPVDSPEQDKLRAEKLNFMNYVIDVSGWFESDLLVHAGGWGDDNEPTKQGEEHSKTKQRENEEYNKWRKIIRDRIPTLPKAKVAEAIGASDRPADVALIVNPNRSFQSAREFREDEYLRRFGTVGAGANVAADKAAVVNDTMSRYGREAAEAETNAEGGYGIITDGEQKKVETTGADVDRAMQEFSAARARIAGLAAMVVSLIAGAVVTIITGGAGAGLAWMLVAGAISGAAGAAAGAITKKAIQGSEFDMNQDGLSEIAEGAITGMIFAGTTKLAGNMMKGLSGASLKAQAQAFDQIVATKPTVWKQILSGAKGTAYAAAEGTMAEGLNIVFEAGLSPIDPTIWMHGWDEGVIRAKSKVRDKMAGADQRLLSAGIVSALTHVGIGTLAKNPATPPPMTAADQNVVKSKLEQHFDRIKKNTGKYFEVSHITIQAFASFAGNKLSSALMGKPIDWNNIDEQIFREFIQQWQGLSANIHADHNRLAIERKHAVADQVKEHGHLLTTGELAHYRAINPEIGVGEIITIEQYLTARRGMFEARAAMWEKTIKRELTPSERAAYQEWCRKATDGGEYQKRLETNPLEVPEVQAAGKKFSTTVKDASGSESIKHETKPDPKHTDKDKTDTKPAADAPKTPDDFAKITGSTDGVVDTSFTSKANQTADPEKIAAEINRTIPHVASLMGPDAQVVGPNAIAVKVGDKTLTVTVVTMAAEGAHVARYRMTGSDTAVIEVSDRLHDKHVERAIADQVAQLKALREAQLSGKPLSTHNALEAGSQTNELSAADIGKIAQVKALLRELAQAEHATEKLDANAIEQLNRDIDALLASMGLGGADGGKRLGELVEPQLTQAERNQLAIRNDGPRRKEAEAKLGAHGQAELHNHFLGIVQPKEFADSVVASEQAKENAKAKKERREPQKITKSGWELMLGQIAGMNALAHKNVDAAGNATIAKPGETFNKRGESGDAVAIAKQALAIVENRPHEGKLPDWLARESAQLDSLRSQLTVAESLGIPAEIERASAEVAKKQAEIAERACSKALTATEETDFNSAYAIRDELIKSHMGGPAADEARAELELEKAKPKDAQDSQKIKDLTNKAESAAYEDFAHKTVRDLILDGLLYNEQSNSLKKLNTRFSKAMMDKVIWEVTADLLAKKQITEAQAMQLRQLTMVLTGFFGDEETRADEMSPEDKKQRDAMFSNKAWSGSEDPKDFDPKQPWKAKGGALKGLSEQLGLDENGELKMEKGLDPKEDAKAGRSDVMGIDIAGPETARFSGEGMERFSELYRLLKHAAEKRGRPLVLRPHVGEGFTDTEAGKEFNKNESKKKGDEASHYERSRENLNSILTALETLSKTGELDPKLVIVRFGHATHATPEQAARMAALGIVAEVNLHSNVQTGSLNQLDPTTGKSHEEEQYGDHALLTFILLGTTTILSTDAHSVMDTTMAQEYERAAQIVNEFLAGRARVRVTEAMAGGRGEKVVVNKGTPYERTDYFLSRDDLNAKELEKFTTGYEQLHKYAREYQKDVAAADKHDKLMWNDLFLLLGDANWKNDAGKRLHVRNLLSRLALDGGVLDEKALAIAKSINPAAEAKVREAATELANEQSTDTTKKTDGGGTPPTPPPTGPEHAGDEQATANEAIQKKDAWQKSAEQADTLKSAKEGTATEEQRKKLASELRRQVPDVALATAVDAGTAKSVIALVFPGNGEMGIKRMNDEVLGQRLNDELIRERDAKVREVFAKHGLQIVDQNYKTTTVVSDHPASELGPILKQALAQIDAAMKPVVEAQLKSALAYWQGEAAKAAGKPDGANDLKSAKKHIENIQALQGKVESNQNFKYDMQIGVADLKEGSKKYEDILAAEMDATKAALMARDTKGAGVDPQDARARVFSPEAFHKFCVETVDIRKQLEGLSLPLNGEMRKVIRDGALDRDLLRAVRKDKIDAKALSEADKQTLALVQRYFQRVNAFDYFAPFTGGEVESQGQKLQDTQELIKQLESDKPISKEAAAEIEKMLAGTVPQSNAASEAQFYNKAATLKNRTVLNADIKDMGLDLWSGFEKKMTEVAGAKNPDMKTASMTAADPIVEFKRKATESFSVYYQEVLAKARAEAATHNRQELVEALKSEDKPLLLLGGDEITVSLSPAFDELGLVPEIVAKLSNIARARIAVTETGSADGAIGHKDAMKKADNGHGLLKKYEQLGQILEDHLDRVSGESRAKTKELINRINSLYTAEEKGSTVLRSTDGKPVESLSAEVASVLGTATVKTVMGEDKPQ